MKTQADKKCRDHQLKIGDKVMLSTKNLKLLSTHSHKLSPKWVGPFMIIGQKHKNSFELDLEGKFQIHPVFHVNLLKPWMANDNSEFPDRHQDPPSAIIINDEEEFEVEAIIKKRTKHGKTQYLVKWKGYREEDCTWEPEEHLQNAPELITEFKKKNTQGVQVLSRKLVTPNSGRLRDKKGDDTNTTPTTKSDQKMAQQYFHNPAKQDIIKQSQDYLWQEKNHEQQIEDEATTI